MKTTATILPLLLLFLINPVQAQGQIGNFLVQEDRDIMSDANRSFVLAVSENNAVSAGVKCFESGLRAVAMADGDPLDGGSDSRVHLTYRFDSEEPVGPLNAALDPTSRGVFLPRDRNDQFIDKMRRGNQLAIRIQETPDSRWYEGVVSLQGATQAINAIGSCP